MSYCAIDFGTSNSAVGVPDRVGRMSLVNVEGGERTMPTAVFYLIEGRAAHEEPLRLYGREAVAMYLERHEGRLMRSMKSILGSSLATQHTDLGAGHAVRYVDVVAGYLRHLKVLAERDAGASLTRAVLGRPVFFVDDDPQRDAQAQDTLEAAARAVGFSEVSFQYEPIAAALDYETRLQDEQLVLVADIGGGTSDFSVVRVGPLRRLRLDRKEDVLANHGVHIAGTDFDRQLELAAILPLCGYRSFGPAPQGRAAREVPSRVYFDLATWHLINSVYAPQRRHELQQMRSYFADARMHARLMNIVDQKLGHALLGQAEASKIAVAEGGASRIDLHRVEAGLVSSVEQSQVVHAMDAQMNSIAHASFETLRLAGLHPNQVDVVYFTGGSTGFRPLVQRISAVVPAARVIHGDRHASVAAGLGVHAQMLYGKV
jgi:hypothetical chaperone protein